MGRILGSESHVLLIHRRIAAVILKEACGVLIVAWQLCIAEEMKELFHVFTYPGDLFSSVAIDIAIEASCSVFQRVGLS